MISRIRTALALAVIVAASPAQAAGYRVVLNGATEEPPVATSGTGGGILVFDPIARTLMVTLNYSALTGGPGAAHIHCCTTSPFSGNVGVAVDFPAFPSMASGTYNRVFDTSLAATYGGAFLAANGGTVAGAEAALAGGLADGRAYVNIHTTLFAGGEIRGFTGPNWPHITVSSAPEPSVAGQPVTFTATVLPFAPETVLPTGTITFNGPGTIGVANVNARGVATLTTSTLPDGMLSYVAEYSGDIRFQPITAGPFFQTVAPPPCTDAFASAPSLAGGRGSTVGTTAGASGESGEPDHAGASGTLNSVWCKWTAPASGLVAIDTTGSLFDTTLAVYTGTAVNALTSVAASDNIGAGNTTSRVTFTATAGITYAFAIDGAGATAGRYVLSWAQADPTVTIFAAILPSARSTKTGFVTTAFASIVNGGSTTATGCSLARPPGFPAFFHYQMTNASNALIGTVNTPADIAPGAAQSYFFAINPVTELAAAEIGIIFDCTNTPPATTVPGLNALLLSAASAPTPDMIAIGSSSSIGVPGVTGTGFLAAAVVNIGEPGTITASVDDNGRNLPLVISVCQTNPTSGACINPTTPGASATFTSGMNETATFSIFATGSGIVPFDPALNRLFLQFKTADGITRGATSASVATTLLDAEAAAR